MCVQELRWPCTARCTTRSRWPPASPSPPSSPRPGFPTPASYTTKVRLTFDFKGTVSRDGYIFKFKHLNQCFLCMRGWFSRCFKSFSIPYTIINIIFAFLKLLTNFENAYRNPRQNLLLCYWSMFSSVDLSLAAWNQCQNRRFWVFEEGC